jgi:hypothetical protein
VVEEKVREDENIMVLNPNKDIKTYGRVKEHNSTVAPFETSSGDYRHKENRSKLFSNMVDSQLRWQEEYLGLNLSDRVLERRKFYAISDEQWTEFYKNDHSMGSFDPMSRSILARESTLMPMGAIISHELTHSFGNARYKKYADGVLRTRQIGFESQTTKKQKNKFEWLKHLFGKQSDTGPIEVIRRFAPVNEVFTEWQSIEKLAYYAITNGEYGDLIKERCAYDKGIIVFDHIFEDCAKKIQDITKDAPKRVKQYVLDNYGDISTLDKLKKALFVGYAKGDFNVLGILEEMYGSRKEDEEKSPKKEGLLVRLSEILKPRVNRDGVVEPKKPPGVLKKLSQIPKVDVAKYNSLSLIGFCMELPVDIPTLMLKLDKYAQGSPLIDIISKPLCISELESRQEANSKDLLGAESLAFSTFDKLVNSNLLRSDLIDIPTRKLIGESWALLSSINQSTNLVTQLESKNIQEKSFVKRVKLTAQGLMIDKIIKKHGFTPESVDLIQTFYNRYTEVEQMYVKKQASSSYLSPDSFEYAETMAISETVAQELGIIDSLNKEEVTNYQSSFEPLIRAVYNQAALSTFNGVVRDKFARGREFPFINAPQLLFNQYRELLGHLNFHRKSITAEEYKSLIIAT